MIQGVRESRGGGGDDTQVFELRDKGGGKAHGHVARFAPSQAAPLRTSPTVVMPCAQAATVTLTSSRRSGIP